MKKLLSMLIAMVMLLSLGTTAFAYTEVDSTSLHGPAIDLDIITADLTYYTIESEKYDKLEIGDYMLSYAWNGTDLVSPEEEVLFYPIYGDDQIVAILTMFDPYKEQGYTVSIDFAKELNTATADGTQDYFIVEAGSNLYIYTNGQASLLRSYGEPMDVNLEELQNRGSSNPPEGGPEPDGQPVVSDGLNINYEDSNSLTLGELSAYVIANTEELCNKSNYTKRTGGKRIDITPTSHPQTRTVHYLDTEVLDQGNTEHCTFYASTIIGNYLTNRSESPHDVMDWAGTTFGDIFNAQDVINDYFGENYSYIYDIYGKSANEFITRNYPIYAAFYNEPPKLGHAVAVTGYSDAGDHGIGIVETMGGYQTAIYPVAPSRYRIRAYTQNCYWTASLYYQYW